MTYYRLPRSFHFTQVLDQVIRGDHGKKRDHIGERHVILFYEQIDARERYLLERFEIELDLFIVLFLQFVDIGIEALFHDIQRAGGDRSLWTDPLVGPLRFGRRTDGL